jgi:L-alanine-DL-glutamate epimerase-like enolase superfamily enzyme
VPEIDGIDVAAYTVPTDAPESDGTLAWDATTIIVAHVHAGPARGLGYTYGPTAVGGVIAELLANIVRGRDAMTPQATWTAMRRALRNAGQAGMGAMALSAVDIALHDLRARLLGVPLARALGGVHTGVPIYGSGGFTSYSLERLREQLAGWAGAGIPRVKMKVGREPDRDCERLAAARAAIGDDVELMVDANGAFTVAAARGWVGRFAAAGVCWFEEPVSSDDVAGLRAVRAAGAGATAIAAGEYAWGILDVQRLLDAEAVDVVQADVTRCGGLSELIRIDGLCAARNTPLSLHCAPALSAHAGCALERLIHLEYFHDHVRLEGMLFDGVPLPRNGFLEPDLASPGHGLELRRADAERFRVGRWDVPAS